MALLQTTTIPWKPFSSFCPVNLDPSLLGRSNYVSFGSPVHYGRIPKSFPCFAVSKKSDSDAGFQSNTESKAKPRRRRSRPDAEEPTKEEQDPGRVFPGMKPRKPRRGRRSEAVAVEDFVRGRLEETFEAIRKENPDALEKMGKVVKDGVDDEIDAEASDDEEDDDDDDDDEEELEGDEVSKRSGTKKKEKMVVEAECSDWPLDGDVGWGISASEYFEKHPIKNVVDDDGLEIDWEGELDDNWVNEIDCLEWEKFAFHPSPLVVLVFERYNRATANWKALKELEKAAEVYRGSKDRLPPRTVKIDINLERDLAYALKVKECPQIIFLRGDRIVYRETEFRTADELVKMIAHFYYNAKKPECVNYQKD
ncbi:hypothetical protein Tsubulata_013463 [Turnera subulata]|uniref:Thioredoxin domain-containing protein n=1 Tax=Turnera subulata TaxID=218843 RepID=A0A9Q0G7X7_9ROSI|nr:hypothetical protein Tsubulata_013463 [Turnera subulata]